MRALPLLALLLLAPLAGCMAPEGGAPPADGAPAWSFTDTEGVVQPEAPANASVLFFMATWCGTCRGKAPMLAEVHREYEARGARFNSLDFDATETPEQIRAWKRDLAQPWPHGVDPGLRVQRSFHVTSQSSVVVLDASGQVVQSWGYGAVTGPALRAALERALAAPAPSSAPSAAA